jgi:hypothetical protein
MNVNSNNNLIGNKEYSLKYITLKLLYIIIIISLIFKSNIESKNESLIFDSINKNRTKFLSPFSKNIVNSRNEPLFLFKNNNKIDKLLFPTKINIIENNMITILQTIVKKMV